jgi:hypothetical protein
LWDDEIDDGRISLNIPAIHQYVGETIDFTQACLKSRQTPVEKAGPRVILQSWSQIDRSLRAGMSRSQSAAGCREQP